MTNLGHVVAFARAGKSVARIDIIDDNARVISSVNLDEPIILDDDGKLEIQFEIQH